MNPLVDTVPFSENSRPNAGNPSGLFVTDVPGIGVGSLQDGSQQYDSADEYTLFKELQRSAVPIFREDVRNALREVCGHRVKKLIDRALDGHYSDDKPKLIFTSDAFQGFRFEPYQANGLELVIEEVRFRANNPAPNLIFELFDLRWGESLESKTVNVVAGENVVPLNFRVPADEWYRKPVLLYPSKHLQLYQVSPGVPGNSCYWQYQTPWLCDGCHDSGAYVYAVGFAPGDDIREENIKSVQHNAGLILRYSYQCSIDLIMRPFIDRLYVPWQHLLAGRILKRLATTKRTNPSTATPNDEAIAYARETYWHLLREAVRDIDLYDCYHCYQEDKLIDKYFPRP
jgi:hypothetical protein